MNTGVIDRFTDVFSRYTPTPRESEDPPLPSGAIRILPNG